MNMQVNWAEHYKAVGARLGKIQATAPRVTLPVQKAKPVTLYDETDPCGPVRIVAPDRDWMIVTRKTFKTRFEKIRDEEIAAAGATLEQFNGDSRRRVLTELRRRVWFRVSEETKLSLSQIGRLSGGKDHSSVLTAIRRHQELTTGIPDARLEDSRRRAAARWEEKRKRRGRKSATACVEG
jgi:hypothetical protein